MAGRGHDHHLLLEHRDHLQVGGHDGQGEQAQVDLVVAEQAQDRLRRAGGHPQVHLPIEAAEALEQPGQDEQAHRHAPAQPQPAPVQLAVLRDLPYGVLDVPLHPVGQLQQQLARGGEGHSPAVPMQEEAPQLLLQELDLAADRGLGDVQPLGRPREPAPLGHRLEHLELADVHAIPVLDRS